MEVSIAKLIDRYARRMIIETTLADPINFFHLDALSSAVPLRIEVDLQLTLMASSRYRLLARRIACGMEAAKPRTHFEKLVRTRANIQIRDDDIVVALPRPAHNAYLLAANYAKAAYRIPWLENRRLRIQLQ